MGQSGSGESAIDVSQRGKTAHTDLYFYMHAQSALEIVLHWFHPSRTLPGENKWTGAVSSPRTLRVWI